MTPDKDDESSYQNVNLTNDNIQAPHDARNPAVEAIGMGGSRDTSDHYVEESEDSSHIQDDQDDK